MHAFCLSSQTSSSFARPALWETTLSLLNFSAVTLTTSLPLNIPAPHSCRRCRHRSRSNKSNYKSLFICDSWLRKRIKKCLTRKTTRLRGGVNKIKNSCQCQRYRQRLLDDGGRHLRFETICRAKLCTKHHNYGGARPLYTTERHKEWHQTN